MAEHKESLKKKIMKVFWRVQQAQMVISVVFWSMTLTGVFYPFIREWLLNRLLGEENVFLGMLLIFLLVVGAILLFGFIYDKLKFWKEQQFVMIERNPYTSWKLHPVFSQFADLWVEMAKSVENPSPELQAKIKFFEDWVARCQEFDPWTKEMRELTRRFAMEGDDTVTRSIARASKD